MLSRFTGCLLGLAAGDCLGASVEGWTAEEIRRRYGRLTDIVGSAYWCFLRTESLEEAVVTAVNLGGDTDTIGAVAGALAGAHYGAEAIPARWREAILAREEIESVARALCEAAPTSSAPRR